MLFLLASIKNVVIFMMQSIDERPVLFYCLTINKGCSFEKFIYFLKKKKKKSDLIGNSFLGEM